MEPVHFIGETAAMKRLRADIECAARSDAKVLVTGETGVGKDVVARLIHKSSARSARPIVTINCAGIPDSLLESELFGHVRGSFTGAVRDKAGLLEASANGTIFLDEVGEMTPRMQTVLLRFLETGEIQRIGANRAHTRVNIRLITATNRDLHAHVASGAFREDLYYRLNVIRLHVPPLRERREDVALLVRHFVELYSRQHAVPRPQLSEQSLHALIRHQWFGNVRELKNVIERIAVKNLGRPVENEDLPEEVFKQCAADGRSPAAADLQADAPYRGSRVEALAGRLFEDRESFWSAVYPMFVARDLTRDELRDLIHMGLERSGGNYRLLVQMFNMPVADYRRFLAFLRKHGCHLPFQQFRQATAAHFRSVAPLAPSYPASRQTPAYSRIEHAVPARIDRNYVG